MSDATTAEVKKPFIRIFENELQREEFARTVYILIAKAGTTPEDYLEVESYAHVGGKLKPRDRIEIVCEDNTWWAEVLVLASGANVRVEMLRKAGFAADAEQAYEAYEPKWAGQHAKWRVLRKSDNFVMIEKLEAKSDAVAWIEENAKASVKQAA